MEQQILQLHNQGLTVTEIANQLGIHRNKVSYYTDDKVKADTFTRVEISRAKAKKKREVEKKQLATKIENLIKEGKNYSQIQKELNLSEWGMRQFKKNINIEATTPKEVRIKLKKAKPNKKERPVKASNSNDPKKRIFKNKDLNLKEKIAVNLGDSKNTIVYTTNKKYNLKELQKKYLGK